MSHRKRRTKDSRFSWARGKKKPERRRSYGEAFAIGYFVGQTIVLLAVQGTEEEKVQLMQQIADADEAFDEEATRAIDVVLQTSGLRPPTAAELESWMGRLEKSRVRMERAKAEGQQFISSN